MKGKNHRGGGVGFHIFIIFNMNKGPIFGRIFGRTYDRISASSGYPDNAKPYVKSIWITRISSLVRLSAFSGYLVIPCLNYLVISTVANLFYFDRNPFPEYRSGPL